MRCIVLSIVLMASACRVGNSVDTPGGGGEDCHPMPASSYCEYSGYACTPYFTCNLAMKTCNTSCYGTADCTVGYMCVNHACIRPGTCGTCTSDSPCDPFRCNYDHVCTTSCATQYDCTYGNACLQGRCVKPGRERGTCSSSSDCEPYDCDGSSHLCKTGCATKFDCAFGAQCTSGRCVK